MTEESNNPPTQREYVCSRVQSVRHEFFSMSEELTGRFDRIEARAIFPDKRVDRATFMNIWSVGLEVEEWFVTRAMGATTCYLWTVSRHRPFGQSTAVERDYVFLKLTSPIGPTLAVGNVDWYHPEWVDEIKNFR